MSSCESMEPVFAAYLAGEASPRERVRAEAHLLDCAECRETFAQAKTGWDAAAEWAVDGVAPAIALPSRPSRAVRVLRLVTAVAAGVMIASLFMRPAPPPVLTPPKNESPRAAAYVTPGNAAVGVLACVDPETKKPVGELAIASLRIEIEIRDGVAQTTVEQVFTNHTDRRLEGTFVFPLPPDAAITRLAMEIDGKLIEGECVEREKARETYEGIVRRMKDPALLEWMPGGLFRCRIFPIEAKSDKRIILSWQQVLPSLDGRMQYVYPLVSETTAERTIGRFEVSTRVVGAKMTSPSHAFDANGVFAAAAYRARADVVLDLEQALPEFAAVAHTGHVACLVAPQPDGVERARVPAGTVFVVDCSASVSEAELDVARKLVERMIDALPGAPVQVIGHNVMLQAGERTGDRATAKAFLARLTTGGGSDLGLALAHAMRAAPEGGEIVYVGEGAPTVGETDVAKLIARARENAEGRDVTFRAVAVGSGADRGTLGALATAFHGGVHAIAVTDAVERRVAEIVRTLGRPAMTDVRLAIENTSDAAPASIGSLYFGERAIVAARVTKAGPAKAVLTGRVHGREIRREWVVELPAEEPKNLWVKRLWAQRRVADLIPKGEAARGEIVSIGVGYQLMTPFTSFLVLENERAYEEHKIERTKKEKETLVKGEQREERTPALKREVQERIGKLLELAYMAFDQRKFDRVVQTTNEILNIDPRYHVALELKEDAQKARHREEYYGFLRKKIDNWKALADSDDGAVIPYAETLRIPTQQEWDEITKRVSEATIRDREPDLAIADEHYKQAERWYQAGDFARAEAECRKAMLANPRHDSARALQLEVEFMQGKARATPASEQYAKLTQQATVRHQQTQLEIDDKLARAVRAYNGGYYEDAERDLRTILEYAKWLPASASLKTQEAQATDMLEKTRAARRVKEADEGKVRLQMSQEEKTRDEIRKKIERKRELELLFGQAQLFFEQQRYDRVEEICGRILYANPNLRSVDEMREVARRFKHTKAEPERLKAYVEEWKRTFEQVELPSVIQADTLSFPARELWADVVSKRRPKGIQEFELADIDDQLKESYARLLRDLGTKERQHVESLAALQTASEAKMRELTELTLVNRPSPVGCDIPGVGSTDVDEFADAAPGFPGSEVGPGFTTTESGRNELYDLRAQVFHSLLRKSGDVFGIDVDLAGPTNAPVVKHGLQIANLQREFDRRNASMAKLGADADVVLRQMEVQITQIQEMSNKIEEYRSKLAKSAAERSTAVQELQYARQEAEILQKSMGALEEQMISLARDKKRLEETIATLNARGVDTDLISPPKLLEGKLTAVSPEIGLIVLGIGRNDGVLEGNEFTVCRGGQFIAKATIERVDRTWSAGRVTLKKDDPRVGDDVSNSIFISAHKNEGWSAPKPPPAAPPAIHLADAPLDAILAAIGRAYGVTIIIDPAARNRTDFAKSATLQADDLPLEGLLKIILESRGLIAVRTKSGGLLVTVPERLDLDALERKTADTLRKLKELVK